MQRCLLHSEWCGWNANWLLYAFTSTQQYTSFLHLQYSELSTSTTTTTQCLGSKRFKFKFYYHEFPQDKVSCLMQPCAPCLSRMPSIIASSLRVALHREYMTCITLFILVLHFSGLLGSLRYYFFCVSSLLLFIFFLSELEIFCLLSSELFPAFVSEFVFLGGVSAVFFLYRPATAFLFDFCDVGARSVQVIINTYYSS